MDKACFQHDITYGDFKDLNRRTDTDKLLHDKAFDIAKNPKYEKYQHGLALKVYKNENITNKKLADELHKPMIRKFNKRKVHSSFIDNIWGADLADMQLISKCNQRFRFLLCVINIHSKYAWVIPLKDKKGTTITNAFPKIL